MSVFGSAVARRVAACHRNAMKIYEQTCAMWSGAYVSCLHLIILIRFTFLKFESLLIDVL